jgi:glycosyltransferase involved in cell wall biosynthesis
MAMMRHGATITEEIPARRTAPTRTAPWLVFSDDWGRHPTSCQHLIRHLLPEQPVTWINMIGTRRPALDLATVRRGIEKLGQWLRPSAADELPPNLQVLCPRVWPGFGRPLERRFNRAWLARQLRPVIERLPAPPVALTTMPTAADLVGVLPVARWVYYCVDDFSLWPGIDRAAARRLEDRLIDTADVVVAVSAPLRERIASRGRTAHLLTHGVDLGFWSSPHSPLGRGAGGEGEESFERLNAFTPGPSPQSGEGRKNILQDVQPPLIVFWGLIDRRLDLDILRALSASLTTGSIVLIGPEDRPDPALASIPRVLRQPAVPLADLPAIAAAADVLVMPYADLPVTRAMQPLKLKEYLATGRPAVVRDLPANREWADCLDVAATPATFAGAVRRRLATGVTPKQRAARARLATEDWSVKAAEFARIVRGE